MKIQRKECMESSHASRRTFLQGGLAAAAATTVGRQAFAAAPASRFPNIVYLHSHDSGRYLKPYGHDVPTPNLQRLARQGTLFWQMHAAAPTCSPSRAALLTGQSPHQAGMLGLAHLGWGLHDYSQHLLHTLRKHGYTSVLAGLQHIAADPKIIGYDQMLEHKTTSARDVAPVAARYLKSGPRQPFFLDVGFFETHREFPAPVDNADYIQPPAPLPDVPAVRRDTAGFHASARVLDAGVGQVLDALDAAGVTENTLVLSTTDHGIAFPAMKCSLRDSGTGISMIMRGPGIFATPRVCDALLSNIDVFPTLCEYLQIEKPAWLTGRSFLPVLTGQPQVNEAVFSEVTYHAAYEPKRSIRTNRYKYIRHYDGRQAPNLPNCDDGLSKSFWMENGWTTAAPIAKEELFDLIFDPNEQRSLAELSGHAATLTNLSQQLDTWMKQTADPLLQGPVSLPPGAHAVDPNATSPKALSEFVPPGLK